MCVCVAHQGNNLTNPNQHQTVFKALRGTARTVEAPPPTTAQESLKPIQKKLLARKVYNQKTLTIAS